MNKKLLKWLIILSILVIPAVVYHRLLYYGLVQLEGQLRIIFGTIPVGKVLKNPEVPDSVKYKIRLVGQIRDYAVQELGLKGKKNYTTYFNQKGRALIWVVTACPRYKLEAYEWDFPLIGSFPYKGFFKFPMAVKEEEKLNKEGYDTGIRTAGGWSTLGILRDPILSGMLDEDIGGLADLIIHELTHSTIFIKDSIDFNENLASFIGKEGARMFLDKYFGKESTQYASFVKEMADSKKFTSYALAGTEKLDSLYGSFRINTPSQKKEQAKEIMIHDFVESLDTVNFIKKVKFRDYFGDDLPNNTFFMSFLRYHGSQKSFEYKMEHDFDGNLIKYIAYLKRKHGR